MASFKDMFENVKEKISARGERVDNYDYDEDDAFEDYALESENDAIKPLTAAVEEASLNRKSTPRRSSSGVDSLFSSTDNSAALTAEIDLAKPERKEESRLSVGRANTHSGPSLTETVAPKRSAQNTSRPRQVAVIKPDNYEEAQDLIDVLKAGDAIILDMRATNASLASRFLDFSFGATAALSGKVDMIDNKIYGISVGKALTQSEIDKARGEGLI